MKAIETVYNGYRFRSRLEARWAVFFDGMGIPYRYEPEGLEIRGQKYLPDFWIPLVTNGVIKDKVGFWAEIKPPVAVTADEMLLWYHTAWDTNTSVLAFVGDPHPDEYKVIKFCAVYNEEPILMDNLHFEYQADRDGRLLALLFSNDGGYSGGPVAVNVRLYEALEAARKARFEHEYFNRPKEAVKHIFA